MSTFTSFNSRLPDPTFGVNNAGANDAAGVRGPGFANVTVRSNRPAQVSRTISGRGVHRETGAHTWEIDITYNPMVRDAFDTVSSFLDLRNGRLIPFYVVLPQNSKPKDSVFATYASANVIRVSGAQPAGARAILMEAGSTIVGSARPGDFFTITDPNDINHQKVYKVAAVETNDTYQVGSTRPAINQMRVYTLPPLTKFVASQAVVNWIDPKFRVIQKSDVLEYQLNTDNLYQYQLSLEEIQP